MDENRTDVGANQNSAPSSRKTHPTYWIMCILLILMLWYQYNVISHIIGQLDYISGIYSLLQTSIMMQSQPNSPTTEYLFTSVETDYSMDEENNFFIHYHLIPKEMGFDEKLFIIMPGTDSVFEATTEDGFTYYAFITMPFENITSYTGSLQPVAYFESSSRRRTEQLDGIDSDIFWISYSSALIKNEKMLFDFNWVYHGLGELGYSDISDAELVVTIKNPSLGSPSEQNTIIIPLREDPEAVWPSNVHLGKQGPVYSADISELDLIKNSYYVHLQLKIGNFMYNTSEYPYRLGKDATSYGSGMTRPNY